MSLSTSTFALSAVVFMTGCASTLFSNAARGYDQQGCVEDAIRRGHATSATKQAAVEFERACNEGDASGCSALGVIVETHDTAPDALSHAARLYDRACSLGNSKGCVNLADLATRDDQHLGLSSAKISSLYKNACDAGESAGCAAIGKSAARSNNVEVAAEARNLLASACEAGRASACFDLAELLRVESKSRDEAAKTMNDDGILALYVKACVAGHATACSRMDMPGNRTIAKR